MAVGKDKVGVLVNMDKELKTKLESIAKDDGRSLTNLIGYPLFSKKLTQDEQYRINIAANEFVSY